MCVQLQVQCHSYKLSGAAEIDKPLRPQSKALDAIPGQESVCAIASAMPLNLFKLVIL